MNDLIFWFGVALTGIGGACFFIGLGAELHRRYGRGR